MSLITTVLQDKSTISKDSTYSCTKLLRHLEIIYHFFVLTLKLFMPNKG